MVDDYSVLELRK